MTLAALAPYALPFGVALALASLLRLVGGAEVGGRLAGVAVPGGFLAAWILFRGATLAPRDVLDLAPHVALGGALLGLVLDAWRPRRPVVALAVGVFALAGLWAAVLFPLRLPDAAEMVGLAPAMLALAAAWALALGRLGVLAAPEGGAAEATALLAALAAGVALVAVAAGLSGLTGAAPGHSGIARPAAGLAAAALGLLPLAVWQGARLGWAGLLGGGGALLALAQALGLVWPASAVPLAVLLLALFAGPTARRLPGPPALAPLWSVVLALATGVVAALVMLALAGPTR